MDGRPPSVFGEQRHGDRHITAHAVSGHGQCIGIQPSSHLFKQLGQLAEYTVALLDGGRITRLGRPGVFRKNDRTAGPGGQLSHQLLMRMETPEYPAGSVNVENHIFCKFTVYRCYPVYGNASPMACLDHGSLHLGRIHIDRRVLCLLQHPSSLFRRQFKNQRWN